MRATSAMTSEHGALYERIRTFAFDDGPVVFPFAARLARDNGWSAGFTARVVTEYRRFVFLAAAARHPVSPSDQVDQVWHLHLLYTESYWIKFCRETLGTPLFLPIQPTEPGARRIPGRDSRTVEGDASHLDRYLRDRYVADGIQTSHQQLKAQLIFLSTKTGSRSPATRLPSVMSCRNSTGIRRSRESATEPWGLSTRRSIEN